MLKRKKPLIKGAKKETDIGLKSGRRKIGSVQKKEDKIPKDNPLLSQPPSNSSTFKYFQEINELHKKAAPKEVKSKKIEEFTDDDFFKEHSRHLNRRGR